jgi:hypothetical protein
MKPIIILGKGPSALYLAKSENYDVAALNNAIWLCEEPTYVFFNDIEPMELTSDDDFNKVKTMIVPSYMHSQFNPRFGGINQHVHFSKLNEIFPNRFNDIDFYLYELHPGDNLKSEECNRTNSNNAQVPSLDEWPGSCGVTAANFLAKFLNYKEFIFAGIDPNGGYHPAFEHKKIDDNGQPAFAGQGTAAQPAGYDLDYAQMVRLIEKYGGTAKHINELTIVQRNELGL